MEIKPILKGFGSTKLIGEVHEVYENLIDKNYDWRSFYNGWLEGRFAMFNELNEKEDDIKTQED